MTVSVIIPVLDEELWISKSIASVRAAFPSCEIIVVDGSSTDATVAVAEAAGATVMISKRGRGRQLRLGASHASGEILVFLHADTLLPADASTVITSAFANESMRIATFRLTFDREGFLFRLYERFGLIESVFTRFGDSCIVVRRSFYDEIGGFPDWSWFEDVRLLQKARAIATVHTLPSSVVTSARKFDTNGIIRQQVRNGFLLLRYLLRSLPVRLL